jgi:signal transduction histidine kinase
MRHVISLFEVLKAAIRANRCSASRQMLARCCLIWLLALWQAPGLAEPMGAARDQRDRISERAWLDDPSNSLGPEQVRSMAWTPYAGPLRRGFIASTTWLRLKIEPETDAGRLNPDRQSRLVLRILPGHLDEIALFDPRHPEQAPQMTGDRQDWRLAEYRSFNQNLVLAAPSEPIEVLLRLRTTSNHGIHVEALGRDDLEVIERQQQLFIGAVLAFLLTIMGWAVSAWWDHRDRVIGAFIVQQLVSIVFTLSLLGFFRVYLSGWLPAQAIDLITSAMFPITAATVLWFHWQFLREFNLPTLGMRCVKWLAAATPLILLLMLAGLMRQALQLTMIVTVLTPLMLLLLACFAAKPAPEGEPRLSRRQLIAVYGLTLAILWNATLPAFGWLPSPPWTMYSAIAYGVVSAMILFTALRARARTVETARQEAQLQLAVTEQRMQQEQEMRREQEQFMTMLTHELTNALATAHLAIGSLAPTSPMRGRGYRAINGMRDIIRRCSLNGAFEADDSAPQRAPVNVWALLQDLSKQMPAHANIVLSAEADLPDCATDRQLLGVVLSNLLDNALKYRAEASAIEVSAQPQPRGALAGLQMIISNTPGDAGRPDPQLVFKKYWRGPGATRFAGSGLGLYLSALIAQRLGGELRYRPENSQVRFELWLPV